ncbi:hypothetical protein, partial [Mesorhizobium sp.]
MPISRSFRSLAAAVTLVVFLSGCQTLGS